jgi:HlyD family secretion protein
LLEATEVVVSSETSGRVLSIAFSEGGDVADGDTLLVIDTTRVDLELASARANRRAVEASLKTARVQIAQAKQNEQYLLSERNRVEGLLRSGTGTQRQFDQIAHEADQATLARRTAEANAVGIEAQLDRIEADIARIERTRRDCFPTSPVSGTVLERYIEEGELLAPGRAMAKVATLDSLWVKVYLSTAALADVKLGDPATVDTESGDRRHRGHVVWTSDQAEFTPKNVQTAKSRANLVYAVKIMIPNPDRTLKAGMPVYVTIEEQ